MSKFCIKCDWGYLRPHDTLEWWHKCPICAYCEFDLEKIHPKHHIKALANPLQPTVDAQCASMKPNQYD